MKISGDGSWEAVTENISNEVTEKPNDAQPISQETAAQNVDDVMDLTENDNEIHNNDDDDDKKPLPAGESDGMNKSTSPLMGDGIWRELFSSALGTRTTNTRSDLDDIIRRNHLMFNSLAQGQSQTPVSSNVQSQHNENSNNNNNGHVRHSNPATWISRTQSAIQALPAQTSATTLDGDRLQNFSRSHPSPPTSSQVRLFSLFCYIFVFLNLSICRVRVFLQVKANRLHNLVLDQLHLFQQTALAHTKTNP